MVEREEPTKFLTLDSIWNDKIKILQPARGYRFALDAVLLAHFLRIGEEEQGLEIGTGCGIITILLSQLQQFHNILMVEVQPELAKLAMENLRANSVANVRVLELDIKNLTDAIPDSRFDLIFANPPYRKSGTGKLNPSGQKAIARHEIKMELEDLFVCTKRFLKPEGRLSVILPDFRESDFSRLADRYHLHWMEKRYVHSFRQEPPSFFLATLSAAPVDLIHHPPLIIYDSPGNYTPEVQRLLKERHE
jgi:tRNA1Val (adenine37-N6)-methyltransferase